MTRKETVSFDEIKRGFSAHDPKRTKKRKSVDFSVKQVEEPQNKFGNECLCQGVVFDSTAV